MEKARLQTRWRTNMADAIKMAQTGWYYTSVYLSGVSLL